MKIENKLSAENISYFFFSLFLLSFTFPVRKILYENNSFITGLFSEYLTIFFEISEFFLVPAFVFFAFSRKKININNSALFLILIFLISSLVGVFLTKNHILAYFGVLKLIEIIFIGIFIAISDYSKEKIAKILLFIALFQGIIGVFQFINSSSLGLNFIGEQPMNLNNTGSPKLIVNNELYLRATGTFLHPNIFACFLIITFFLTKNIKNNLRHFKWLLLIPLVLTFSRIGFVAFLVAALIDKKNTQKILIVLLFLLGIILIIPEARELIISRLHLNNSLIERIKLTEISMSMIYTYPWGVGVKNFILNMPAMDTWLYQPVHNIFLLTGNENGLLAGLIFLSLFFLAYKKNPETKSLLAIIFIFGLFDHFLISIHAGMVLLVLVFGLCFRPTKKDILEDKIRNMVKKFVNK